MIAPELEEFASGVLAKWTAAAKKRRRTNDQMTELGEKGLGVLLTESDQQGNRPVSLELLPLPITFPENEHLSRAVRSRVARRMGWQGWANDGVRSMNEIHSKTSASEAGSRPSLLQLTSLSRICSAYQGISTAECKSAVEAFKALCGSAPGNTGNGVKQATFKEGLVSLSDPCSKMADGADLLTGLDFEAWRGWRRVLLRSPSELHEAIALEGRVAPHTDPELKRKPRCHGRLVRDMSLRGLVSFGPPSKATVRVFVVPQKLGKQRLIFDTRRVNQHFLRPWHCALPGWTATPS